ncbi:MAG: 50S ribosomal protein L11 methyltransferase [Magnetospiraceae bacterium]
MTAPAAWRVSAMVPDGTAFAFQEGLAEYGPALVVRDADSGPWALTLISETEPATADLTAALAVIAASAGVAAPAFTIEPIPETDWLAATYRGFPPIQTGRFFVHGSHYADPPPPATLPLCIDAATAFGSGEHATTRACLLALEDIAKRQRRATILDMGTGTGILAMAAAALWKSPVLASDIDGEAVRVATLNARINRLRGYLRAVTADGYGARAISESGPYDLIFANILARPLCRMAKDLARHLAPGGMAVLSGFVAEDVARVRAAHTAVGLTQVKVIAVAEWRALVMTRRSGA